MWKPGQSGNPRGFGGEYQRCLRLCREASYEAAEDIIRLGRESDDDRIRFMASTWIYERAWGKPKDFDPADEPKPKRDRFVDPSKYTLQELELIAEALQLMVEDRSGRPADRSEEDFEIVPPNLARGSDKSGVR
jgi:hypothetical protein